MRYQRWFFLFFCTCLGFRLNAVACVMRVEQDTALKAPGIHNQLNASAAF